MVVICLPTLANAPGRLPCLNISCVVRGSRHIESPAIPSPPFCSTWIVKNDLGSQVSRSLKCCCCQSPCHKHKFLNYRPTFNPGMMLCGFLHFQPSAYMIYEGYQPTSTHTSCSHGRLSKQRLGSCSHQTSQFQVFTFSYHLEDKVCMWISLLIELGVGELTCCTNHSIRQQGQNAPDEVNQRDLKRQLDEAEQNANKNKRIRGDGRHLCMV